MPSCILHPSQEATKNGACKNRQDRDTSQQPSPLLDPGVCAVRIPSFQCMVGSLALCPSFHAHLFTLLLCSWGPGTAHPRGVYLTPTLTCPPGAPLCPGEQMAQAGMSTAPYQALLTLLLRKHLPFPRWAVGLFQEQRGLSLDSCRPCSPTSGVFSMPPPTCFFVSPSALPPPPHFLPLSKWKSQLRLCF